MTSQSKKTEASEAHLWELQMVRSDLSDENDIEEIPISELLKRSAAIQRTSAYHEAPDVLGQSSTAASVLAGSKGKTSLRFLEEHGTQMVDIYVGEEKILFRVYKDILCHEVKFFDRMFNGNFKEAKENTAILPEDDPEVFDMLMSWITYDNVWSLMGQDFRKKLDLWVLADKFCVTSLQTHVMEIWRHEDEAYGTYYTAEEFQYISEKTANKSEPRQYAVRMLRFQSLQPPTEGLEYSNDSRGEPIPFSDVDTTSLTKFLAKNEEMLEIYLDLSRREDNNWSGNDMDPRNDVSSMEMP
ncbi:uncharacterized protein EAE98_004298 [Botrytis deweyae]|uniref:BTB domain-containing protein n=1 Tax=Botrytis deweyae TaxID=2478750 RepID=A0ABQ7IQH2_9HELO|nr:uncharacterized protein EAE98_004298 [Botrytis deweyae]KAF7931562.1 hypothetical protein EAE98_004298 [Botrytis deweyae]